MLKEEIISLKSGNWARACDTCHMAACTVYCRADSAYLCTTCDADIHSANPLASRHHRVPVMLIPGSPYGPQAVDQESMMSMGGDTEGGFLSQEAGDTLDEEDGDGDGDGDDEAASWLIFNPPANNSRNQNNTNGFFLGGEGVDEYLDLVEYNSCQHNQFSSDHIQYNDQQFSDDCYNNQQQKYYTVPHKNYGGENDSVVPVQFGEAKNNQIQQQNFQHQKFETGFKYETLKTGYAYPASHSHSISVSSMELGVVPDSATSDVSISHPRPPKGTIDLFSSSPTQMPTQLTPMDREARVQRYREKKKTRKFEKTIRYASRKAYAETRPRVKGRFAKRTDLDVEVDQMFSTALMTESGYGIVPSF